MPMWEMLALMYHVSCAQLSLSSADLAWWACDDILWLAVVNLLMKKCGWVLP